MPMNLKLLKILWSTFFDRVGHYDHRLCNVAGDRLWFIPMYHRILKHDETDPFDFGLGVNQRHFDEHLAFFRERFHVCTVQEGLAISEDGRWPDRPLLSITFDDGYLDNIELALPLLEKHGCPATFFICTSPILEGYPFWWDLVMASATERNGAHWQSLLASLNIRSEKNAKIELQKALGYLWSLSYADILAHIDVDRAYKEGLDRLCPKRMQKHHVKRLADQGMEVAAHTHHHPNLTKELDEMIHHEIVYSKALLEDWTGHSIKGFAAPHGFVDDRVKRLCSEQGMVYAASTDPGANQLLNPYHLARFGIADAALATLKRSLTSTIA